jgi:hypothetical protein
VISTRSYAVVLLVMTVLFTLRVAGQALVAFFHVQFLPPMEQWYSGLLPYPILLPIQLLLIVIMSKIIADFARGVGWFTIPRKRLGLILEWLSYLYAGSMILRYTLTMAWHPERRWFGGTIPIWFHILLAGFLYTLGHYHRRAGRPEAHRPSPIA